jgi:hypothetical protein
MRARASSSVLDVPVICCVALLIIAAGPSSSHKPRLIITEIQYNPTSPEQDETQTEWVEIRNVGGESVNLKGIQLTSGTKAKPRDAKQRYVLGDGTIAPGAYAVIGIGMADSYKSFGLPAMIAHCGEQKYAWLVNGGDGVALRDERGDVIDEVVYDAESPWPLTNPGCSLQYVGPAGPDGAAANDDPKNWVASDEKNADAFDGHGRGTPGGPPKPTTRPAGQDARRQR